MGAEQASTPGYVPFAGARPALHDELHAIETVARALESLDPPARRRVLSWACQRYAVPTVPPPSAD